MEKYHLLYAIFYSLFLIAFGLLLALLEIEIEGPHGWAVNLPTWRRDNLFSKIVFGGRPVTGYHLLLNLLLSLVLETVAVLIGLALNLPPPGRESALFWAHWLSMGFITHLLLAVFWDYWWFIFNPDYTWRGHCRDRVPWHPRWWGQWLNVDHLFGLFLCAALAGIGYFVFGPLFTAWLFTIIFSLLGATAIFFILAPLYHRWRKKMGNDGPLYPNSFTEREKS